VQTAADTWPGADRRAPARSLPSWVVRAPLAEWLQAEARAAAARHGRYRVLDVGCGVKPYYPFFAEWADAYVGVDVVENPQADLLGPAEALPVEDASFDVVLCNQVLEHADDPAQVVRELHRVAAPGGVVLASTHGVQVYHPSPVDLWRWTHEGLRRLFDGAGAWASLTVAPAAGSAATVGMLLGTYAHLLAKRLGAPSAARPLIAAINAGAAALDRALPQLRGTDPGTIVANYHVTAVRE
jgi:SAM-dependent methyltransferase